MFQFSIARVALLAHCTDLSFAPYLTIAAVQSVRPFGVFVKIDGYRKYGLVHFSQASGWDAAGWERG